MPHLLDFQGLLDSRTAEHTNIEQEMELLSSKLSKILDKRGKLLSGLGLSELIKTGSEHTTAIQDILQCLQTSGHELSELEVL